MIKKFQTVTFILGITTPQQILNPSAKQQPGMIPGGVRFECTEWEDPLRSQVATAVNKQLNTGVATVSLQLPKLLEKIHDAVKDLLKDREYSIVIGGLELNHTPDAFIPLLGSAVSDRILL